MIAEGDAAPDFTLSDQHGNTISLKQFKGKSVVLYFYPKDDTPGCTKEACAFRDAQSDYEAMGAVVLGISPDSSTSHLKFAQKYELPFTLLADPQKEVIQAYGVWKEKNMYGKKVMGVERTTILIDGDGIVRRVFPKVQVAGHVDKVLEELHTI